MSSSDEPMSTSGVAVAVGSAFGADATLGGEKSKSSIEGFAGTAFAAGAAFRAAGLDCGTVMLSSDESMSTGRVAGVVFEGGARLGGGGRAGRVPNEPTSVAGFVGAAALAAEAVF
jgi:hypothetical protein